MRRGMVLTPTRNEAYGGLNPAGTRQRLVAAGPQDLQLVPLVGNEQFGVPSRIQIRFESRGSP